MAINFGSMTIPELKLELEKFGAQNRDVRENL